jgi:hypothetical protein
VRKKFPILVCRPSTSLTGRTTQRFASAKKSRGVAGAAAVVADAAAAGAVGEAAGAVAAAEAAARPGGVAVGARRCHGRVPLQLPGFCFALRMPDRPL